MPFSVHIGLSGKNTYIIECKKNGAQIYITYLTQLVISKEIVSKEIYESCQYRDQTKFFMYKHSPDTSRDVENLGLCPWFLIASSRKQFLIVMIA